LRQNGVVTRQELIDRKHEVQGRIRQLQPRVERARREAVGRRQQVRADALRKQLDALMAEEGRLRILIDRTG
jgi:hypothetical protein